MYGTESGEFTSNKTVYFIPVVKFHNPERINKIEKKGYHPVFHLKLFQWQCSCPTFYFVPCCDPIPMRKFSL